MKFYWVRALFIVLLRCPVHTLVLTPVYGLPLSQSDQRIRSVFQTVYNNNDLLTGLLGPCKEVQSPIFFVRPEFARAVRKSEGFVFLVRTE